MATSGRKKVNVSAEGGGHSVASIGFAAVRYAWGGLESFSNGLFSIIYAGKRRKLPEIQNQLLLETATSLASKIRRGEVKSSDVVDAYIKRIKEINPIINAVVDDRFKEALEDARKVDKFVESGVKTEDEMETETPFLGVPFSSKEAVCVKGLSSASGLVCRKDFVAERDSEAVSLLKKSGAIPLVVTNTSELCMWWETYNKLHGTTNNPYDTTRTVGGSSGGEAALIASAGSVIGFGTDLGGSIRLPSFFSGIFGHKPSSGSVPHGGQYPPVLDQVSPYVVTGPMARYASDLRHILKVLTHDSAPELQLDTRVDLNAIRVFHMADDCGHPTSSPLSSEIQDSIFEVVKWLESEGAQCQAIHFKNLKQGLLMWAAHLADIEDQTIASLMSGDVKKAQETSPPHQEMWKWVSGRSEYTFPLILNACLQEFVAPILKTPFDNFQKMSVDLRKEMDDILGNDGVFLYPTYPTTAPYHGQIIVNPMNLGYLVAFNAIGLPVTQCPVGVDSTGLPMGFQIVTGHKNDRLALTLAEELEKRFGGWRNPSQAMVYQEQTCFDQKSE